VESAVSYVDINKLYNTRPLIRELKPAKFLEYNTINLTDYSTTLIARQKDMIA